MQSSEVHSRTIPYSLSLFCERDRNTLHCAVLYYTALTYPQPNPLHLITFTSPPNYHPSSFPRTVSALHYISSISMLHLMIQLQLQLAIRFRLQLQFQLSIDCIPLGRGDLGPEFCTKCPPIEYPYILQWMDD